MLSLSERCGGSSMVSCREMAPECSLAATWSIARLGHLPVPCGFFVPSTPFLPSGFPAATEETKWEAIKLSETQQQQLKLKLQGFS